MIAVTTDDGVEVRVNCIDDRVEIENMLTRFYTPADLAKIKKLAVDSEELIFSLLCANEKRLRDAQELRLAVFHLDTLRDVYRCVIFHVHKDHLGVAEKMAAKLCGAFKNMNGWEETTRLEMKIEPQLPEMKMQ